jgi:hypothetical protein
MKSKLISMRFITSFLTLFVISLGMVSCSSDDDSDTDTDNTDCVQQDLAEGSGLCDTELAYDSSVTISIDGSDRVITSNSIPDHLVGTFINGDITEQNETYTITTDPELTGNLTSLEGNNGPEYIFGIL